MNSRTTRGPSRRQSWFGAKKHLKRLLSMRAPHALLRMATRLVPSLGRQGRLPAPAHLDVVAGHARGVTFAMLGPDRCIVAKELYWGSGRRPAPEDALAVDAFVEAARLSDVVLDVGAYTGLFTIVATLANPSLEVHAFEIVEENLEAMAANCRRNGVIDRVALRHQGVGAPGESMIVPASSDGSALPDFYSRSLSFDEGSEVDFVSLDSIAPEVPRGARVSMKIDVEGTEAELLMHGRRFLSELEPLILCEVLPWADARALEEALRPHGYGLHLVREEHLEPRERIEPHERFRDWLFVPEGRSAAELDVPVRS